MSSGRSWVWTKPLAVDAQSGSPQTQTHNLNISRLSIFTTEAEVIPLLYEEKLQSTTLRINGKNYSWKEI